MTRQYLSTVRYELTHPFSLVMILLSGLDALPRHLTGTAASQKAKPVPVPFCTQVLQLHASKSSHAAHDGKEMFHTESDLERVEMLKHQR